jgi:hypothetical protein
LYFVFVVQYCYLDLSTKECAMQATMLGFRAAEDFAQVTRGLAKVQGLKSSEYIRQAVQEKNERVMAQRIAALSKALSAEHAEINQALEGTLSDGLQ